MIVKRIEYDFSICKVTDYSLVDLESEYCFIGKTDDENSLVCPTERVPANAAFCNHGWNAFRIEGVLDFALIGILSEISSILAENKIGIIAISTYNTDYFMTKKADYEKALSALSAAGYQVI